MKRVTYINASAGSGKTYTLTHKLAELIEKKVVKPEQVIMTTFSVKAANEMKEEAKKVLYDSKLFDEATRIDQAMIGTIHSVAQALIKKYWFFLGLSPDMGVMDEDDTNFYVSQSLADLPSNDELRKLHAFCEDFGIQAAWGSDKRGLDYDFWKSDIQRIISYTTNYEVDNYQRSIDESLGFIRQFVDSNIKSSYSKEELTAVLKGHQEFIDSQPDSDANRKRQTEIRALWRGVGNPTVGWYKRLSTLLKALKKGCPALSCQVRDELESIWHWPLVYEKQEEYIKLLFELADRWRERYANYKKEKNLLDFNDMEKYMRDLLNDPKVSEEISMDYRYLFVDEYQDCSPIQVKIFDRLSELMEESIWVGDYKQAIYGFRGSDITLPKAVVDRIALEKDGCKMAKPLDTSYRSLPDIVNVCNETFKRTFANVLTEKEITLKEHRQNEEGITSLRYWDLTSDENVGVAGHVARLVQHGVDPKDIAVLNRANAPLYGLAGILNSKYGIPASREDLPVMDMKATPLVLALLALLTSEKDSLAKAQIALLTEEGFGTKEVIESKLMYDADENNRPQNYLNDVPLVKRLLELRPMLKQQSLAAQIETMIIELDLFNEVKKVDCTSEGASCLDTVIKAAGTYEQHCIRMGMAATVSGFIDYLKVANPIGSGDANGVQLHTYHSSKGLQWKYVILTSLKEKICDMSKTTRKQIFGIHFNYTEQPSAENPYPEVYISVIPFVYGAGNSKVPDDIEDSIERMPQFTRAYENFIAENNRLMYVGMTRPKDVLILALEKASKGNNSLQWLQDIGLGSVKPDDDDLLGVGYKFVNDTMKESSFEYHYYAEDEKMKTRRIPYNKPLCEAERKAIAPSTIHEKGDVAEHYDICKRMPTGSLVGKTMADVGDCNHQIYCGIEAHIDDWIYYRQLIDSYGVKTYLTDAKSIRTAWESLVAWLTEQFGQATHIYHERPFTLLRDGHVLTGSIDLVWQTEEGDVLIDFKTCPMGRDAILKPESDHYAGWYAGQLDAYTDALEAAGEKVIKRLIYYPVSGLVCEIDRAFNWKPPYMENTFHIFGVDGLDMNKLWEDATKYCSDDGFSGEIKIFEHDTKKDDVNEYDVLLIGASSQGLTVTYMHGEDTHLHIELPWLGSIGDVKLAFALMQALRERYPDCGIFMDDNSEAQFALEERNYDALVSMRLINLKSMIENTQDGSHMGAPGYYRDFMAPSQSDYPDKEIDELVFMAHDKFVEVQWLYGNYETPGKAKISSPDGKEYTARILSNSANCFVGMCEHVILSCNRLIKDIPARDFMNALEGNQYFKKVDAGQFTLEQMPAQEWKALFDGLNGELICPPKTYLLRWNPTISSFKLEHYRKAMAERPDGFGFDWSVYEWEEAQEGDHYYMLRTGDDKPGIVFHGVFTSDPYEGDDWAGQKGKTRRYMDIDCYDCVPADEQSPITIEVLEKAIPNVDWRKGHSGELLSEEDAEKLDELWEKYMKSDN